jgi:hypothetical protein
LLEVLTWISEPGFFINLPTGGIAIAILFFFLNLNPHKGKTFQEHVREFDFLGLGLIIIAVICLLLGFNSSETSCESSPVHIRILAVLISVTGSSAETVSLLVVGCVLLFSAGLNEYFTARSPIIPPRLFKV